MEMILEMSRFIHCWRGATGYMSYREIWLDIQSVMVMNIGRQVIRHSEMFNQYLLNKSGQE